MASRPIPPHRSSDSPRASRQHTPVESALLNLAWEAYEEAGAPFGPEEEALWVWIHFGQDTTAN